LKHGYGVPAPLKNFRDRKLIQRRWQAFRCIFYGSATPHRKRMPLQSFTRIIRYFKKLSFCELPNFG
jgi:hypothetical protein